MVPTPPTPPSLPRAALFFLASALLAPTAPAATFTVTSTNNFGNGTLRKAVNDANSAAGEDTILFAAGLDGAVITLTSGQLSILENVAIDASALTNGVTVSGSEASRIFRIALGGHTVSITNLTIVDGRDGGAGPDPVDGAAIRNNGGTLTLTGCRIMDSTSVRYGGAIHNNGGTINLNGCIFSGNHSDDEAGAIYNDVGTLVLVDSVFSLNTSTLKGGAIFNDTGNIDFTNCTLSHNSAGDEGGAVYSDSGVLEFTGCTLSNNTAGGDGGAIHNIAGTLTILNSDISSNSCPDTSSAGGGIYNVGISTLNLTNSTISNNSSGGRAGGLHMGGSGALTALNTTFSGNSSTASTGGGIYIIGTGIDSNTFISCTIANNFAKTSAGGLNFIFGNLNLENTVIAANTTDGFFPDISKQPGGGAIITPTGANVIGDHSTVESDFPLALPLIGNSTTPADPLLAPLANYGGPTDTLFLLPTSPALDAAIPTVSTPLTDQRGLARSEGGATPDIGALEVYQPGPPPIPDTDGDLMDDILEPLYGFVVGLPDGYLDADADGSTNAQELGNHTDPHDATSNLRILSIAPSPGHLPGIPMFDISWTSFPGLDYTFEFDENLDFSSPGLDGPHTAAGFTETRSILFTTPPLPFRDFLRIRRN